MEMSKWLWTNIFLSAVAATVLTAYGQYASAAPFVSTRYVHINHMDHSAYVYDEHFQRLPDSPYIPGTSIEALPEGKPLWMLGATIDIVKRNPDGSLDTVSDDPAYYEMNHHFTWYYYSPKREVTDPCGINIPLATGSELTDFRMPSGYGYKLDGGFINGGDWHWANPYDLPHSEDVYLRFVLLLDDEPDAYEDINVTWVDMVPCQSDFAIPPGKSELQGPPLVSDRNARIVAVYPHVHDHAKSIELRLNNQTVRKFRPEHAKIGTEHDDVGEGITPLHVHRRHLPTEGLSIWTPGVNGPIVRAGDSLTAAGKFYNPHNRAIDNMTLFVVFWQEIPAESMHTIAETESPDDDFDPDDDIN
jgi:hypothetical protein